MLKLKEKLRYATFQIFCIKVLLRSIFLGIFTYITKLKTKRKLRISVHLKPRSHALIYSWGAIFACMQNLHPCVKGHFLRVPMVLNKIRINQHRLSKFNNGGILSITEAEDFPLLCSSRFFVLSKVDWGIDGLGKLCCNKSLKFIKLN